MTPSSSAPGRGHFRLLLIAIVAIMLASLAAGLTEPSPLLAAALEAEPDPLRDVDWRLLLALLCGASAVVIAMLAGLFLFRRWGRSLAWWATVAGLAVYPFTGPTVLSPLASFLFDVGNMGWGALLALAYFSPLRSEFLPSGIPPKDSAVN